MQSNLVILFIRSLIDSSRLETYHFVRNYLSADTACVAIAKLSANSACPDTDVQHAILS